MSNQVRNDRRSASTFRDKRIPLVANEALCTQRQSYRRNKMYPLTGHTVAGLSFTAWFLAPLPRQHWQRELHKSGVNRVCGPRRETETNASQRVLPMKLGEYPEAPCFWVNRSTTRCRRKSKLRLNHCAEYPTSSNQVTGTRREHISIVKEEIHSSLDSIGISPCSPLELQWQASAPGATVVHRVMAALSVS